MGATAAELKALATSASTAAPVDEGDDDEFDDDDFDEDEVETGVGMPFLICCFHTFSIRDGGVRPHGICPFSFLRMAFLRGPPNARLQHF